MRQTCTLLLLVFAALLISCGNQTNVDQENRSLPTPTPAQTALPTVDPAAVPTPIPATPVPTPTPVPTLLPPSPTPVPPLPTVPVVSDAVPTKQELLDIGLTDAQAECFIATIDPNETGRVETADLFVEALSTCT